MRVPLRNLVMAALAAATLAVSFAAPNAFASAQHPAAPLVSGRFCLSNDPDTCMHGNGAGAQVTTSLGGNGMTVTNVTESTNVCSGLHLYSFHDGHGLWLRIPAGANTLNLSTTRDQRAEFVYFGNGIYGSYANGCSSDLNIIEVGADQIGLGVFVRNPPQNSWTDWSIG